MHAPVRGEVDFHPPARPGKPDMRQPAFLLQAGAPLIIQCALVREEPFLPAREKDCFELQPLGGMQRHDRHRLAAFALLRVHHQRNVLEEAR